MLISHAYGEPGAAPGLLGLAVVKPKAFEEIVPQWRWRFLCSWEPGYGLRYSTPHMGAPYLGEEAVVNLAYLLLLSTETTASSSRARPRTGARRVQLRPGASGASERGRVLAATGTRPRPRCPARGPVPTRSSGARRRVGARTTPRRAGR